MQNCNVKREDFSKFIYTQWITLNSFANIILFKSDCVSP